MTTSNVLFDLIDRLDGTLIQNQVTQEDIFAYYDVTNWTDAQEEMSIDNTFAETAGYLG